MLVDTAFRESRHPEYDLANRRLKHVYFHGRDFGLRNDFSVDAGDALHFPEGAASLQAGQFQSQLIPGPHRPLKPHAFKTRQDKDFATIHSAARFVRKYRRYLRHGLAYQDSGHNRPGGKMALKERFVKGHILKPDYFVLAVYFDDPIHQQERVAVRQVFSISLTSSIGFRFVADLT